VVEAKQIRAAVEAARRIREDWQPIPQLLGELLPQVRPEPAQRLLWELMGVARRAQEGRIGEVVDEAFQRRICLVCESGDLLVVTRRRADQIVAWAWCCERCGARSGDETLLAMLGPQA